MGRLRLDSGEISVLGAEPGKKGHGIPGIISITKINTFFKSLVLE